MAQQFKLRSTIKYPTSLIVNGVTNLGLEVAESLLEQGGYVILIDTYSEQNINKISAKLGDSSLVSFIDYAAIPHLEEDLRRLDYVFYLTHEGLEEGEGESVSTQSFLKYSNYLDTVLTVASQFEAKFLVTTSIRAHLKLMDNMDIEVNYGKSAISRHTVYTNMEVQRYAESLTMEYVKKVNLDARVIRVGEIIGDGMEFSGKSSFTDLVVKSVTGQELELRNDGLETEWYVHLLDAAYGIVRAQFTKDVKGEIFSLAYENPVSDLSLAYKLQELEPNAREIKFSQEEQKIAPLKLHKPAPNLSTIGWRPRVEFTQAVIESLNMAKQLALDGDMEEDHDDGVVGKLRSFLSLAKSADEQPKNVDDVDAGPVSRLIAERKRQEEARQKAIEAANSEVKAKVNKREKTLGDRINAWVYRNFFDTRTNFGILRNVTPTQFVTIVIATVVFGIFYFAYLAPAVVIGRNVFLINSSLTTLQQAFAEQNLRVLEREASSLEGLLAETNEMLGRFDGVARLVAADSYLSSLHELLETYTTYTSGVNNIAYAIVPLQDYLEAYESNVRFRPSSENYLSVATGTDYSVFLDDLNTRRVYAELGAEMLVQAGRELAVKQVDFLPGPLQQYLEQLNSGLLNVLGVADYAGIAEYAPDMLGGKFTRTYLVFLLDNSRPMPIGGSLSAYMLLTLQNGAVSDVRVQAIDEFEPDLKSLPDYAKTAINANAFNNISSPQLRDLARISEVDVFSDVTKDIWEEEFSLEIDSVALLDFETASAILGRIGEINVEGQPVNNQNLLTVLLGLQSENQTVGRRNDVAAQVMAQVMEKLLNSYQSSFMGVASALSQATANKSFVLARTDLVFNEVIETENIYGDVAASTDMPIKFSLIADEQVISPTKYPSFFQNLEVSVRADSSMNVRVLAKFPAVGNISEASLCVPLVAKQIDVSGAPQSRVVKTQSNNLKCAVVDIVNETELSFEWDTVPFESSDNPEYNLSIGLSKLAGTQIQSNVEISLASSLSFSEIRPSVTSIGGKVAITEELLKDQIIELDITKQ